MLSESETEAGVALPVDKLSFCLKLLYYTNLFIFPIVNFVGRKLRLLTLARDSKDRFWAFGQEQIGQVKQNW